MVTCQTLLCVCVQYVGSIVIRFNIHFKLKYEMVKCCKLYASFIINIILGRVRKV